MFKFIFFNVYEIFAVATVVLVAAVLIFAVSHRRKLDAAERAASGKDGGCVCDEQMAHREVGLASAGLGPSQKPASEDDNRG